MIDVEKIQDELAQPVAELTMPLPHIMIRLVLANITFFLAARGTGKTSRGIALYIIDMVYEMPRSSGAIIGLSFEHLGDNTLPPLLSAFTEFGFVDGEHYVVGVRPPDHFERPHLSVYKNKYDHVITWHNGTTIHLISLAKKASANGISAQWGVFDEAKFMDEKALMDEIFPIFRGNDKHFKLSRGYLSKFFATDKLADPVQIQWLLDKRKLNDQEKIDVVVSLAVELNRLKVEHLQAGILRKKELAKEIEELEVLLSELRANMTYFVEASGLDMVPIHGKKWLRDKKMTMTPYEFRVAIENVDPDRPGVGFYPDFLETTHCYESATDIDPDLPFIIGSDYQHSVSPIVAAQLLKWGDVRVLAYVDEADTIAPQGLAEAVQLWCDKHREHRKRLVYYVYDQTATGRRNDAASFYEIVVSGLKKNKWAVREVYTGAAPLHYQKYADTQAWLQEDNDKQAALIRINKSRCNNLVVSIKGAGARTVNGKTEKDKRAEQEERLDQRRTTHYSDVFDMINHAVLKLGEISFSSGGSGGIGVR